MVDQVIIYSDDNGGVAIVRPTAEGLAMAGGDIHKLAQKDVPEGKKYKIVSNSDIPTDRTFREAWSVDQAELTDGIGAESNSF